MPGCQADMQGLPYGAAKARSLSEIEKRALSPLCFPSITFHSARSQRATLTLRPATPSMLT